MGVLYWSIAPLPSAEVIPALRAYLECSFPLDENRAYLDALVRPSLPPRVAVARLCGLSLLPPLLARAGISSDSVQLGRDEHGRPYGKAATSGASPFDFNISHSADHAACALLAGGGRVGIDIEESIPPKRALPLIRRYCTEGERHLLRGLTDTESAAFTRIWTIREALCKQDGRGMPLRCDATRIPDGVTIQSGLLGERGTRITLCYPIGTALSEAAYASLAESVAWE